MTRGLGRCALGLMFCLLSCLALHAHAAFAASIDNDATNRIVTMSGSNYTAQFDYDGKAVITSLKVNNREVLDAAGIYSSVTTASSAADSASLTVSPSVTVAGSTVTAAFSTPVADEVWMFTVNDDALTFRIARTYNSTQTINRQGTPRIHFAENAFDQVRWPGDGGNWPVGGTLVNQYQTNWLATGSRLNANMVASKEQISYAMLDSVHSLALKVTGSGSYDNVTRGEATEAYRDGASRALVFDTYLAPDGLAYASGTNVGLGYTTNNCDGNIRCDGGRIFNPVQVTAGQEDDAAFTFAPVTYGDYYDIGDLRGVDGATVAKMINDYGRWMMQDVGKGASFESTNEKTELDPFEGQWIGQMLSIIGDSNANEAMEAGWNDVKNNLQDSDGKVLCCNATAPPSSAWFPDYRDFAMGYALGVAKTYALTGDSGWLNGLKTSVERGLDYELAHYTDPATHFVTTAGNSSNAVYNNDYWESSTGAYDGYATAMLYDALSEWAQLERHVLSDPSQASTYESIAAAIRTNFAKPTTDGGFWSAATHSFLYGSGNQDVRHLPTQGAVLKTDLVGDDIKRQIVQGVEDETIAHGYVVHPMNTGDLYTANADAPGGCNKGGENGGYYGAPDGDFYAGFPALNDRAKIPGYIAKFVNRYKLDGFYGNSSYAREDISVGCGFETNFPSTIMPVWGLYTYAYGFQPQYDELVIAPFISSSMIGSVVNYHWRGQPITVAYNNVNSYTVSAAALPTDLRIRWINQTPNTAFTVNIDGSDTTVDSDAAGNVEAVMTAAGTHTYNCATCAAANDLGDITTMNDDNAALAYDAAWTYAPGRPYGDYGGDAHYTNTNGAGMTFTFTGTSLYILGEMNSDMGAVDISLDGNVTTFNAYHPSRLSQVPIFSRTDLADTLHTVTVTNRSSNYAVIDAVQYGTDMPQTVNDDGANIAYSGSWTAAPGRPYGDLNGDVHYSNTIGSSATFTFKGTSVSLLSEKNADMGDISVSIDYGPAVTVDCFNAARLAQQTVFSQSGLDNVWHTITVKNLSTNYATIDAFVYD